MFIEQPPWFFRAIYPDAIFRMDPDEKAVYLTFDDGPIPEVTPWVLELLDKHNIKATFFMVGDNIRKHPDVFRMVVERGHRIGNHTFNHIRGFEYLSVNYLANTDKANELMKTDLFRPPHGHMRWMQYMTLKRHYKIVMWDLVTRDYSKKLRPPQSATCGICRRFPPQCDEICPQRVYHYLPRFAEVLEQRKPAIRTSPCHRLPERGRIRI